MECALFPGNECWADIASVTSKLSYKNRKKSKFEQSGGGTIFQKKEYQRCNRHTLALDVNLGVDDDSACF
jgi:hypothetical protein